VQGGVLAVALPVLLWALRYPVEIVEAGVAGSLSVACFAGVQVFRVGFKLRMNTERDIGAELGGLLVMLPLTWLACRAGASVAWLVGCYGLARLVFLALVVMGTPRAERAVPVAGAGRGAAHLLREAWPLGVAGLLVALYDSLAMIMLSKLAALGEVAQYAAATRFVFPVIIVVQALSAAFFPPLVANWTTAPQRFRALQQTSLDLSVFVGGGLFCGVFAGSDFLMGLLGPEIGSASLVLRVMSVVVLARAVTTSMSPLIVVAGRQRRAMGLTMLSIVLQAAMLLAVVPRFGILGAAIGYLAIELSVGVVPVSLIGLRVARVRLSWAMPVRLLLCAGVAVVLAGLIPLQASLWSGVLGGLAYVALVLATRTFSLGQLRAELTEMLAARRSQTAAGGA
jgi:O-antigen/teichoic acid export membrane protein